MGQKKFDIKDLIGKPQQRIWATPQRMIDEEAQTIELAFASAEPFERWWGIEVLDMENCDLSYFQETGAILFNHNPDRLIGKASGARVDKDGIARCTAQISRADDCRDHWTKVTEGILFCCSVGYEITEATLISDVKGVQTYTCKFKVYEVSLVSMPADPKVGVGRSADMEPNLFAREIEMPTTQPPTDTQPPSAEEIRQAQIFALGRQVNETALAEEFVLSGGSLDEFRAAALQKRRQGQAPISVLTVTSDNPRIEFSRSHSVRNFKGPKAEEKAYRFGRFFIASLSQTQKYGNSPLVQRSVEYCRANGILLRATHTEGINEDGGYLVPHEFGSDMVDLREMFGVFRRNTKVVPMMSDSKSVPRRVGGLTAYFIDEADQVTSSKKGWDRIKLMARKLAALAKIGSELAEDAIIDTGDDLAGEIAYAFSQKEDDCGFNGDGTSTYGGIQGVCPRLKGLSGTIANIAGLVVATGTGYATSYGSIVLGDFNKVKGKLPQFAYQRGNVKWYVSQSFWSEVMEKLITAAGGATAETLQAMISPRFLGYPVEIAQVLPQTSAVSQVCALFGDLSLASMLGDRRQVSIAMSTDFSFDTDVIDIRGTERFDINVHDVGNAHATAASRVPGPIVGLITAAS